MTAYRPDWHHWKALFERRAGRPLPELEADHDYSQLPPSMARSLAVFQLGESGGGTVARQARGSGLEGLNDDYADAVALFVREEHRHANILAMCVRLMHGKLLQENWTARLFVAGRRLMGLRLKILVLLTAEVVGLCFYKLMADRLPPGNLRNWLLELVEDERSHLEFHCQFLRSQVRTRLQRALFTIAWRAIMGLAGLAVLIDHRETLRDLYIERQSAWNFWTYHRVAVEHYVLDTKSRRQRPDATSTPSCAAG